ncbi:acyltransferase family protein [Bradyrhizobium sp. JYMT SZCCT0180]|uniref:acyltransferase family protein n=1 Tax=Bradyrhizobium sp. JYMT SZCCT0180 TaxID=2807666 RepID=UPI001BA91507|nr:acyltransferase family protein [Bradyrhizobium sp. JYMT SZCCT0180]MBR1209896.1 acyltransferase [Bradyrhizobium sp. JYMT SZCCT0180]
MSQPYRPDIDGLRAIAVLLIVIFHLGGPISGGFVGVDVFFVISGFLITKIIIQDIDSGSFSFSAFYARRIRRIFPALLVMLTIVLVSGAFLLMPGDYEVTARSVLYASVSASNFYFLKHTGYFDVASEMMPLLHTWSLAIEEQFYLVWPATLVFLVHLFGRSRRNIGLFVAIVCAAGFVLCIHQTQTNPKAAFYLPHTRAWELDVGALLAVIPRARYTASRVVAHIAGLAGLALILWSALSLTRSSPFPSYHAALPVAGAALLVAPWRSVGLVQRLLSFAPFTFVGKISYSLYLWHWPIITLYRHYQMDAPMSVIEQACLAVIILVVSWASWTFVEEPFRRSRRDAQVSIGCGLTATAAVGLLAFVIVIKSGFPERAPGAEQYASLEVMWNWDCRHKREIPISHPSSCVLGTGDTKIAGLLIGDSHAQHFAPLIDVAAQEIGISFATSQNQGCMPLLGSTSLRRFFPPDPGYGQHCAKLIAPILSYVRSNPDINVIILAAAWVGYPTDLYRDSPNERGGQRGIELMADAFDEFFRSLDRPGLKFLVIGDVPQVLPYNYLCLSKSPMILRRPCPPPILKTPRSTFGAYQEEIRSSLRDLTNRWPNVSVLLPHDLMCDDDGCSTSLNGDYLYRDLNHLRRNLTPETATQLVHLLRLPSAISATLPP